MLVSIYGSICKHLVRVRSLLSTINLSNKVFRFPRYGFLVLSDDVPILRYLPSDAQNSSAGFETSALSSLVFLSITY
jgi:hypothetical protein